MSFFSVESEIEKKSLEALLSLGEEAFLMKLILYPYFLDSEKVKMRLKEISKTWKKRIEAKKSKKTSWEHILYLVHLFPRSLDLPEFGWLKERYYSILIRRQWDSNSDKSYWQALEEVRKAFNPTKPKTPEKKYVIARKFEYYRNQWAKREISKICEELLEIHNCTERDEDIVKAQFLRKIKIPRSIMDRELERLNRICSEEIKSEGDYIILPLIIQNELNLIEDKKGREEGEKFWMRVWKPIGKKANRLRSRFIMEVAKETKLSAETVKKLLRQASKETRG
jgi:hypothetical protein